MRVVEPRTSQPQRLHMRGTRGIWPRHTGGSATVRATTVPEGRDKLVFQRLPSRRTNRPIHYRQMALFKATAGITFATTAKPLHRLWCISFATSLPLLQLFNVTLRRKLHILIIQIQNIYCIHVLLHDINTEIVSI